MRRSKNQLKRRDSATSYIIESLIPYTEANIRLIISPNAFFNELERIDRQRLWQKNRDKNNGLSHYKRDYLKTTYYRLKKNGLIAKGEDGGIRLTYAGLKYAKKYKAAKLDKQAMLLVIFDIPEKDRGKRRQLRNLLKELNFKNVQRSVWLSKYDYKDIVEYEINNLRLEKYVRMYECANIK